MVSSPLNAFMNTIQTFRLDELLVARRLYTSRARARDAILRGCVTVDGKLSRKPGQKTCDASKITINDAASRYVSRAALKLVSALEKTGFDPKNSIALDIGASTGGFCQVLLERGAKQVFAIDVGHGQMAEEIGRDPRLINIEGLNARDLISADLNDCEIDFITCDVSFISLRLALPPALGIAQPGARGIFLIKPQFEVGKKALGKNGIVTDATLAQATAKELCDWLSDEQGWKCTHLLPSPIKGGDGNREFLMAGVKDG